MIPPHLFYQLYLSVLEQNDCAPPNCGELSEYTDSAHTEVEDLSSRYMNGSNVYDRCEHDTKQLHPSCTANMTPIFVSISSICDIRLHGSMRKLTSLLCWLINDKYLLIHISVADKSVNSRLKARPSDSIYIIYIVKNVIFCNILRNRLPKFLENNARNKEFFVSHVPC